MSNLDINNIFIDDLDINNISNINLGLTCIKSDYYNDGLYKNSYHYCIIYYKNGKIKNIKLSDDYIYDNLYHLLSDKDKKHFTSFVKKTNILNQNIDDIINNIINSKNYDNIINNNKKYDNIDIVKLNKNYSNNNNYCCYNLWHCLYKN